METGLYMSPIRIFKCLTFYGRSATLHGKSETNDERWVVSEHQTAVVLGRSSDADRSERYADDDHRSTPERGVRDGYCIGLTLRTTVSRLSTPVWLRIRTGSRRQQSADDGAMWSGQPVPVTEQVRYIPPSAPAQCYFPDRPLQFQMNIFKMLGRRLKQNCETVYR